MPKALLSSKQLRTEDVPAPTNGFDRTDFLKHISVYHVSSYLYTYLYIYLPTYLSRGGAVCHSEHLAVGGQVCEVIVSFQHLDPEI